MMSNRIHSVPRTQTFLAGLNRCIIASSKVGLDKPGALQLDLVNTIIDSHSNLHVHLKRDYVRTIQALSEENRREIDVGEVASVEIVQPISGKVFDPLCARAVVELWVI
jgi:hypothetical protein